MNREFKRRIAELIEVKKELDNDLFHLRKRISHFNQRVKEVTGQDKLDYDELVLMLCECDKDEFVPTLDEV